MKRALNALERLYPAAGRWARWTRDARGPRERATRQKHAQHKQNGRYIEVS